MRFSWLFKQSNYFLFLLFALDLILIILNKTKFATTNPILNITIILITLLLAALVIKRLKILDKGLDGETAVRIELEKLPSAFLHLNDFNYNNKHSADIVVIGPTGVFTLEVKNYKAREITFANGILLKDGHPMEKDVLKQAYGEATHLQTYLKETAQIFVPVHPIVVFTNRRTKIRLGKYPLKDVSVIGISWLNAILSERTQSLTPEQCTAIKDAAKKYASYI